MSFGLNLQTLIQIAPMIMTGGTSALATELLQLAAQEVGKQAFSRALSQAGISGGNQNQLVRAFGDAFSAATGVSGNANLTAKVLDAAFRHGGLADSVNNLADAMTKLTLALGQQGIDDNDSAGGGGRGVSWLEAIAKAMGEALGNKAAELVKGSQSLNSLAGDDSTKGAQKFQQAMAKFQADAQLFSMLSDAFSNAIKSIGQGLQTMASKQ